jgi:cytochrome oxidase Cu insertion factor (SCO1/SenC/PrrC family)
MLLKKTLLILLGTLLIIFISACAPEEAPVSPLVGTVAPDFTLDDAIGTQASLSDYAGQPVLLFFHMAVG